MDINCGLGYGIMGLKREYDFKKCVGFTGSTHLLKYCKDTWNEKGVSFYKDFILSKQGKADFLFASKHLVTMIIRVHCYLDYHKH